MMRHPERYILQLLVLLMIVTLSSCYNKRTPVKIPLLNDSVPQIDSMTYARHLDSITFARTHHYSENFNFVVRADSVVLLRQQPEEEINNMQTDSFPVKKDMRMVVADIRIIANGQEDSVWVQLATEQSEFGWTRESALIPNVVPADTISQFILFFSDTHLIIFLVVIGVITVSYWIRHLLALKAPIVHASHHPRGSVGNLLRPSSAFLSGDVAALLLSSHPQPLCPSIPAWPFPSDGMDAAHSGSCSR